VTLGLNLFSQGIDPQSDFRDIDEIRRTVEYCNQLPVAERHPYGGDLVYTAFSGSHQDAIKKGMYAQQRSESEVWDVPYLPIDPQDLGRTYEAIIRVNSQSGKGGVAYLMETEHHLELPRGLQVDFAREVQAVTDLRGDELTADELLALFHERYLAVSSPYELVSYEHVSGDEGRLAAAVAAGGAAQTVEGAGNGPIEALGEAVARGCGIEIRIRDYHEHALSAAADATAVAYIEAEVDDEPVWGVALHPSIVTASLRAVVNAVDRALAQRAALTEAMARD
jgi:2-isopropylmalate synthase